MNRLRRFYQNRIQPRINWKSGNGEFIALAVIGTIICTLAIFITSFVQLSSALSEISRITTVVGRSVAICSTKQEAEQQTESIIENMLLNKSSSITDVTAKIEYADGFSSWGPGSFVVVSVKANVHTTEPYIISGFREKKMLIAIENQDSIEMSGSEAAQFAFNFLVSQGISEEGASGILGNIQQECGMNPALDDPPSKGICQWTAGRQTAMMLYASSKGKSWTDLQCQLEFMLNELKTYSGYESNIKNATDVSSATIWFCNVFERPGIPMLDKRIQYAKGYYSLYS